MKPAVPIQDFIDRYKFKKCAGEYGKNGCYYLCVARGCKMLFLSIECFAVNEWTDNDPRIHKNPNCRYRDTRTAYDFIIEMAREGMIETDYD